MKVIPDKREEAMKAYHELVKLESEKPIDWETEVVYH
jgi:hypothetical protein